MNLFYVCQFHPISSMLHIQLRHVFFRLVQSGTTWNITAVQHIDHAKNIGQDGRIVPQNVTSLHRLVSCV